MKTRIGVPSETLCLPLRRWLRATKSFEVQDGTMADLAMRLRKRELDVAFVSPIEYARESSEYRILPGFAVSSRSGIALHFREGLREIGTMAANPGSISEIVLARIVLAEEFETAPPIVPLAGVGLQDMLTRADSALLAGDAHLLEEVHGRHFIDVAEVWSEMMDLPYVHGVLCAREGSVTAGGLEELVSQDWNLTSFKVTDPDLAGPFRADGQRTRANEFLKRCSFALTGEVEEGLMEFLQYAHYHGIIPDIPPFQLYPSGAHPPPSN